MKIGCFYFIFIYCTFNDAVGSTEYTVGAGMLWDDLLRMWKEVVITYLQLVSHHSGETEEYHKTMELCAG
jgi:hypothetical protein